MLGRQQVYLELSDEVEEYDELTEIMSNTHLNNNFLALAREVNTPPPSPSTHTQTHTKPIVLVGIIFSAFRPLVQMTK